MGAEGGGEEVGTVVATEADEAAIVSDSTLPSPSPSSSPSALLLLPAAVATGCPGSRAMASPAGGSGALDDAS